MGFIYSKFSRFILFGDSVVLSMTHVVIPIISASFILNLDINMLTPIIGFIVIPFWMKNPKKNLREIDEDKKRGYKTLMTMYKNGKDVTHILLSLYFILIFLSYFLFDLGNKFLFVVFVLFIIKVFMDYSRRSQSRWYVLRLFGLLVSRGIITLAGIWLYKIRTQSSEK